MAPSSDLLVRIDGSSAGFDAAASAAGKAALRLDAALRTAAVAQEQLNKATAQYGAGSAEAVTADKAREASLVRVARAQEAEALASKRATETMARDNAARVASAEAASAKQAAALKKIGGVYGGVGLAAAAGLALAAKAAADFESKFAQITSLSRSTSPVDLAKLKQASFGFADIGTSASGAADAEIELVKAGISVKDQLGGALAGTLDLAAAGQLAVGDAASIAAEAMTQFQLSGKDIPHVADLLAAGADKALGSVQDLGEGMKYSGLIAHQLGISIDSTVGVLAEFAQAGLKGAQGGTTLQQVLRQLTGPTAKAAAEIKTLGLNVYDSQGNFAGLSSIAGQLQDKLGGMSLAQRTAALNTLFTSRAVRGATILYQDGSKGVDSWAKKVEASGFAAEQARGKMDSLTGDLQKLKAEFVNTAIDLGDKLQPALRLVTQDLLSLVTAFNGLPDSVKTGVVQALALTAAVGAGVFAFNKAKTALLGLRTSLQTTAVAEGELATASGLTNVKMLGLKAGAGLAGIALLSVADSAGGVSKSLGVATTAAGYAAIGFSVGGPLGAALGGLLGLLSQVKAADGDLVAAMDLLKAASDTTTPNLQTQADALSGLGDASRFASAQLVADANKVRSSWNPATLVGSAVNIDFHTDDATRAAAAYGQAEAKFVALQNNLAGFARDFQGQDFSLNVNDLQKTYDNLLNTLQPVGFSIERIQRLLQTTAGQKILSQALKDTANAADKTKTAIHDLPPVITDVADAWKLTDVQAVKFNTELVKTDNMILQLRGGFRGYQAALDDATAAIKTNGQTLDINTAKGRANATALDGVAAAALTAEQNMHGAALVKFNNDAHDKLVLEAEAFGMSDTAAKNYADRVLHTMVPATDAGRIAVENLAAQAVYLSGIDPTVTVKTANTLLAAQQVKNFRDDVNTYLAGIQPETVPITLSAQTSKVLAQLGGTFATGGPITGGVKGKDSVPILAMPGEHVLTTADVAAMGGHAGVMAMRGMLHSGGLPHFSTGGIVGKDVPLTLMTSAVGMPAAIAGVESLFTGLVSRIGSNLSKKIDTAAAGINFGPAPGAGGGVAPPGGAAAWAGVILAALGALGQSPSWLSAVEGRMNRESGGNPTIVNKWDSNWAAGTPSVGLMQVIGPTFAAYAGNFRSTGPFEYGVSVDPLANTYAGLNYALARYGSLSVMNAPGGYDTGGSLKPGWTPVYNGLGHDETVLPYPPEAIARAMKSAGGYMGGPAPQIVVQAPAGPFKVVMDIGGQSVTGVMTQIANDAVYQHASHESAIAGMSL